MQSRNFPFNDLRNEQDVVVALSRFEFPFRRANLGDAISESLWELLAECWARDPLLRPSLDALHQQLLLELASAFADNASARRCFEDDELPWLLLSISTGSRASALSVSQHSNRRQSQDCSAGMPSGQTLIARFSGRWISS